jgi:hypothetical protein
MYEVITTDKKTKRATTKDVTTGSLIWNWNIDIALDIKIFDAEPGIILTNSNATRGTIMLSTIETTAAIKATLKTIFN